jgi:cold shock CspA family protein
LKPFKNRKAEVSSLDCREQSVVLKTTPIAGWTPSTSGVPKARFELATSRLADRRSFLTELQGHAGVLGGARTLDTRLQIGSFAAKLPAPKLGHYPYDGYVKWWDAHKGCGMISIPGYPDVFAHFTAVRSERKVMLDGERVTVSVRPPTPAKPGKKARTCWEVTEVYRR